jgi:hypothetical protein
MNHDNPMMIGFVQDEIFQEMFQNCLEIEIDVPKKVQTMLKLCLIIRCQ